MNDPDTSSDRVAWPETTREKQKNEADVTALRVDTDADDADPEGKGMEEAADHAG